MVSTVLKCCSCAKNVQIWHSHSDSYKKQEQYAVYFFQISQIVFEILSFLPMQICLFSGIVKNRRIFAGKSLFFHKNEKTSQLFLKLTILFQI